MAEMYDVKVEAGVVGTLLRNPNFYYHFEQMKPKFFSDKIYQILFYVIQTTINDGSEDVSDFSIYLRISGDDKFSKIFDSKGIDVQDIIEKLKNVGTDDPNEYKIRCKKVIDYAFRRDSSSKLRSLANDIENGEATANEANMMIHDTIDSFSEQYIVGGDIPLIGDKIDEIWEEIELMQNPEVGYSGIPTKFPTLNEYLTYEKGELITVVASQKMGKSFWGVGEALHKLKNGVPTAVFDSEVSTREYLIRMLSSMTQIENRRIKTGNLNNKEKQKLIKARDWLKEQPFTHIYNPNWTFDDIYITARELQKKIGLKYLIYDYIKANDTINMAVNEHNYLGDMTNFLKNNVAGKLDLSVLTFSQKSPKEDRPSDSAKIARYSSAVILFLAKTPEEIQADGGLVKGGNRKVVVINNRLGRQFENGEYINLYFNGDIGLLQEAEQQPKGDSEIFGG